MSRLFIGGLTADSEDRDLEDCFSKYGKINNIWIARNPPGFGFVVRSFVHLFFKVSIHCFRRQEFDDTRDAEDAMDEMNGKTVELGRDSVR